MLFSKGVQQATQVGAFIGGTRCRHVQRQTAYGRLQGYGAFYSGG
jgi:hypothetical protein